MLLTATATARLTGVSRALRLSRTANRGLATLSAVTASAVLLTVSPGVAQADSGGLIADTNAARMAAGVGPLSEAADLDAAATRQAQRMAASGVLAHTPGLGSAVCCWLTVGENVGEGPDAGAIHAAFMASTEHRDNILDHLYTQMGVGYAVDAHGQMWVSEIFRQPVGSSSTGTATPPAQAPVAKPPVPKTPVADKPVVRSQHVTAASIDTPKPAASTAHAASPVVVIAPLADLPGDTASRDLSRLPLDVASKFAVQLSAGGQVAGTNPVSRLLNFAAKASQAS